MTAAALVRFVLRRLALAAAFLLITSFGVFALVHLAPGDPVRALLGTRPSDPETLAALRAYHHLDDPLMVQFGKWLVARRPGRSRPIDQRQPERGRHDRRARRRHRPARADQHGHRARRRHPPRGRGGAPAWNLARSRRGDVRCRGDLVPGLRDRHPPALPLRRRARVVPDLRTRRRSRRPAMAPDAARDGARPLHDGDRGEGHPGRRDRGAGQGLCGVRAIARTRPDPHPRGLRAPQRARPDRHRRRARRRGPARQRGLRRGHLRAPRPRLADRRGGAEARHPGRSRERRWSSPASSSS